MRYHPVIMIGGSSVLMGVPRRWGVLVGVLLVHLLVLGWLQQGLNRAVLPQITPVTLISVPLNTPSPLTAPEPVPLPPRAVPTPRQPAAADKPVQPTPPATGVQPPPPTPAPAAVPMSVAPAAESPPAQMSTSPSPQAPPAGARTGPGSAGAAPPSVVLPSAQAAYLHNPPPAYPAISRRLAEQGRVMVRVLIGTDGLPQKAELQAGSGYDRLDRAALDAVMRWRFVPGRRGDVPETMWVTVPIVFNLE